MNSKVFVLLKCVVIASMGLFIFCFFNCIKSYPEFEVEYSELHYEELTFEKYDEKPAGKSGYSYEIYFREYEEPFRVNNITQKKMDKNALKALQTNTVIKVYFRPSTNKKYTYDICEMKSDMSVLLSLADYIETNQRNQIVGMICLPILIVFCVVLIVVFTRLQELARKGRVGDVKLEHRICGNLIQVCNSLELCSLVINNRIVDKYEWIVATRFCLKGTVYCEGREVTVEAKMGFVNMRLYCDGKLVGTKFMGLG
ncbi:MAG: hypothetical protein E7283_02030 [Lachnospiraceae bacterium]|nr:hypothetical protein [Lachnospiraceae bacterium]